MQDTLLGDGEPLTLEHVACCICGRTNGEPIAVGEDFEYRTSPDSFLAMRCPTCDVVYLDPRPSVDEFGRIYPDNYHAFEFTEQNFGLVHNVRSRFEARRVLGAIGDLPAGARIVDVGCGDGFHLELLRRHGPAGWILEGVDSDKRAVSAARDRGLTVHEGSIQTLDLPESTYDFAILIQTVEHLAEPGADLEVVARILKPGGRVLIVTDNTQTLDFRLFRSRHWGGYHFPRHWNLFNRRSLSLLAEQSGLRVDEIGTIVSPVNWVYSIRNLLDDVGAPRWLINRFSLSSPASLAAFTMVDGINKLLGRGALLRATLRRPA